MEKEKNNKLVLIGGGGHCKSVLDAVIRSNSFSEIVITDPNIPVDTLILGKKVVGNDEILPELFAKGFKNAFVTIGSITSAKRRRDAVLMAEKIGFYFPVIMDPSAVAAESARIRPGVYVGKNAVVNADARIEEHCILNTGSIVEHDCQIGAFTHVAVSACVCGGVRIGTGCLIGANATVIQGLNIPDGSIVPAGSVVRHDMKK